MKLSGVVPPIGTPLLDGDRVDEDGLRRLNRYLIEAGVNALLANGSMGGFAFLTDEEQVRSVAITVSEVNKAIPVIGGPSLSISYIGTFLVFLYVWLPYMILPTQAALERVPANLIEASADLGALPRQTFWTVVFPLALPGLIAGSIFTFSLTLGDYIIPQIVGTSSYFLGQAVYTLQGTAGNVPLAAAFTVVPIVIMAAYLTIAKRMGAFDAL